jgi:hypothetical protein
MCMTASLQRAKSSTSSGLDIHANFEKLIAQTRGEVPTFQNSLGRSASLAAVTCHGTGLWTR